MDFIVWILSLIGLVIVSFFGWIAFKTYQHIKPKVFDDALDLVKFIRTVYECKLENNVPLYGFVDSVYQDDSLVEAWMSDKPHLNVRVLLITNGEKLEIDAVCNNLNANINKGDFVGVLPLYNQRHNIWDCILIAKLEPIYLGRNKGFKIQENYLRD